MACSGYGTKTFSALPLKPDVALNDAKVGFGPRVDQVHRSENFFDHLGGVGECL